MTRSDLPTALELAASERRIYAARCRLPRRQWTPQGLRLTIVPAPPMWGVGAEGPGRYQINNP
jgi:hypothetical protein